MTMRQAAGGPLEVGEMTLRHAEAACRGRRLCRVSGPPALYCDPCRAIASDLCACSRLVSLSVFNCPWTLVSFRAALRFVTSDRVWLAPVFSPTPPRRRGPCGERAGFPALASSRARVRFESRVGSSVPSRKAKFHDTVLWYFSKPGYSEILLHEQGGRTTRSSYPRC